jgi:hypothetical protein
MCTAAKDWQSAFTTTTIATANTISFRRTTWKLIGGSQGKFVR